MSSLAGDLRFTARVHGGRVAAVEVTSTRPQAARLLRGRSADEAQRLVPMLFSLCGRAQGIACAAACAAARGDPPPSAAVVREREREVAAEAAREHLWRLLVDWPALLGQPPRPDFLAGWYRLLAPAPGPEDAPYIVPALRAFVAGELERMAGAPPRASTDGGTAAAAAAADVAPAAGLAATVLGAVSRHGWRTPADPLPLLPADSTAAQWLRALGTLPDEDFCAAPTWHGQAAETGALARHAGAPPVAQRLAAGDRIGARIAARLLDIDACARHLADECATPTPLVDAAPVGQDVGLARVETARGVLLHGVRLEGGRVADYAIVAPTEWNFHPRGAFVREAVGVPARDARALELRLRALILALDPCVGFDLVLEGVEGADV
ncbi:MAG: nickel-dependent hydrogenase large subunit [Betaproteobacteria bacterium]|nr:nickel-dependent hydrogenase large subunit [Betaproteobacteria bacterium]